MTCVRIMLLLTSQGYNKKQYQDQGHIWAKELVNLREDLHIVRQSWQNLHFVTYMWEYFLFFIASMSSIHWKFPEDFSRKWARKSSWGIEIPLYLHFPSVANHYRYANGKTEHTSLMFSPCDDLCKLASFSRPSASKGCLSWLLLKAFLCLSYICVITHFLFPLLVFCVVLVCFHVLDHVCIETTG